MKHARCVLLIGMLCILAGTEWLQAETYTWTDKSGNLQFSDHPPNEGKAKKLPNAEPRQTIMQEAETLATQWYASLCRYQDASRIQGRYRTLQSEAMGILGECRRGDAKACDVLGVPHAAAVLQTEKALIQMYIPPNDIASLVAAKYGSTARQRAC